MFGLNIILLTLGAWCCCDTCFIDHKMAQLYCAQELRLLQECAITDGGRPKGTHRVLGEC